MSSADVAVRVQPRSIKDLREILDRSLPDPAIKSTPEGLEVRSRTSPATRLEVRADAFTWWRGNRKILDLSTDYFDVATKLEGHLVVVTFRYLASNRGLTERLSSVRRTKHPVFVSRALGALTELEHELPPDRIEEAISAPSDFSVLLTALSEPAVITQLTEKDPLAAAKLRGVEKQQQLLRKAGGALTAEEVAEILGISRQAVDKRRRQGQLVALAQGRRGYAYPGFQLENGKVIPHLEQVLQKLSGHDPWMKCAFFVNPNSRLDNRSPLQALRAGNIEEVLQAAMSYGEQGAA